MISHTNKCIFIHVSKCAGTSIERAFGIDTNNNSKINNVNLYGWHSETKQYLQHSTPEELMKNNLISQEIWNTYYKFIVVRNPWSRAVSDYFWMMNQKKIILDSFKNFIENRGGFKKVMQPQKKNNYYTHLYSQKKYFFIQGKEITYDRVIRFENIENELKALAQDLGMSEKLFEKKSNRSFKKLKHYSLFFNQRRKKIVEKYYLEDINYLNYSFEDNKKMNNKLFALLPSIFQVPRKHWLKFIKEKIKKTKVYKFVKKK